MGLSKTRGFLPNCGHWMGNMMINHEIMRNTWSTKWPTCRQSHMGIPPQRHRPATWKAYTKQQMESSRQMEEPAIMTWRCLELSKKGYNLKPCLFNVFNSRTLDDSGWGVLILGNSPIFSLQLCRSSILTFADYEHYFFLRECLAGAPFSLAEIENGKPGISLAMPSDLFVFFHQALRGNRKNSSCILHCAILHFHRGKGHKTGWRLEKRPAMG